MKMMKYCLTIRNEVPPPPRSGIPGRGGQGGEGREALITPDIVAIPTLSAAHPQPFSPECRGQGSQNLSEVEDAYLEIPKLPRRQHFHQPTPQPSLTSVHKSVTDAVSGILFMSAGERKSEMNVLWARTILLGTR